MDLNPFRAAVASMHHDISIASLRRSHACTSQNEKVQVTFGRLLLPGYVIFSRNFCIATSGVFLTYDLSKKIRGFTIKNSKILQVEVWSSVFFLQRIFCGVRSIVYVLLERECVWKQEIWVGLGTSRVGNFGELCTCQLAPFSIFPVALLVYWITCKILSTKLGNFGSSIWVGNGRKWWQMKKR